DLWNEPDNRGGDTVRDEDAKVARVEELLPKAFAWARSVHPVQPLTSGVWAGNWTNPAKESKTTKIQLAESDVITFHNYGWPEEFESRIVELKPLGRPLICTEYMARGNGTTPRRFSAWASAGLSESSCDEVAMAAGGSMLVRGIPPCWSRMAVTGLARSLLSFWFSAALPTAQA